MRRLLTRGIPIVGMLGLLGMSLPGCADNETMLFVRAVMVPSDPPACDVAADASGAFYTAGVMDVALTDSYWATLLVGSGLVSRGSKKQLKTESNRIVLKGAEVSLLDDSENDVIDPFTVPGSGFVDLGTSEDPGYGLMGTVLIPPGTQLAPGQIYIVDVKVFGETLGGAEITSKALRYPIYTCAGCLVSFPPDANDPAANPGSYSCQTTSSSSSSSAKEPCRRGQDDYIDCRLCVANNPSACTSP
jgi:hypothetical protein